MVYRLPIFLSVSFLFIAAASVSSQNRSAPAKREVSDALTVKDSGKWRFIQKGIEFRKVTLERPGTNDAVALKLVRLDTRWVSPHVVSSAQYQLKGSDVKNLAARSGAIAMINANYFDEQGRPLGFLKVGTQVINRNVSKSSLFTGIFGIDDDGPFIQHRDDFQPAHAKEAIQSGPLLLSRGTVLEITRGQGRFSRRALVGIDKDRRLIIGVTDAIFGGLAWIELQELFSTPRWQLETLDLLNLDGGGSAQLYVKTNTFEQFVAGTSDVPVALGFFVKNAQ
jgi:exopolysaccharide biosynthesis protein